MEHCYKLTLVIFESAVIEQEPDDRFWFDDILIHENKVKKDLEAIISDIDIYGYVTIKFNHDMLIPKQLWTLANISVMVFEIQSPENDIIE